MFHQLDTFDRLLNCVVQLKLAFAVLDKAGEALYGLHLSCGEVEAICGLKARWGINRFTDFQAMKRFLFPSKQYAECRFHNFQQRHPHQYIRFKSVVSH